MSAHPPIASDALLDVRGLTVDFRTPFGLRRVLDGVSLRVAPGRTLGVLGESGSGKSVTAAAIMGLLDDPPARMAGGEVWFRGRDVLRLAPAERARLRGPEMAMVFQDALAALNPGMRVGEQVAEMFRVHRRLGRAEAGRRAAALLAQVRIPDAEARARAFPHQFSGGMLQRVVIAMAIALDPPLVVADEPTTALDVTVQAQILDLLRGLQAETGMAMILISHDVGVIAEIAHDVAVMYAGRVVERGRMADVLDAPAHPYTRALLASIPAPDQAPGTLAPVPGAPPVLGAAPSGCPFAPRCRFRRPVCDAERPAERRARPGQAAACHFVGELPDHG